MQTTRGVFISFKDFNLLLTIKTQPLTLLAIRKKRRKGKKGKEKREGKKRGGKNERRKIIEIRERERERERKITINITLSLPITYGAVGRFVSSLDCNGLSVTISFI